MPRPSKARNVCCLPDCSTFAPAIGCSKNIRICLSVEEYESVRLLDYSGSDQQTAAEHMGVSRSTLQALYSEARRKIARFLVEGTSLQIDGGNYRLCEKRNNCKQYMQKEGDKNMRIAVTYGNGEVFQHFGHTEQFKVYNVENGQILSSEIVDTNGQGHGALAGFLFNSQISVLICGGIGGGARNALAEAGIELYPGASGNADAQVQSFLQGKLQYNPNTMCNHHSHEEGHTCGEHGCGEHTCG